MDSEITGGRIFYTFPFEIPILGKFQITETLVVSWLVLLLITGLCIWLTHAASVERSAVGLRSPTRLIRLDTTLVAKSAATKGII